MKLLKFCAIAALVFTGAAAWRIAGRLSADALGVLLGMAFVVGPAMLMAFLWLLVQENRPRRTHDASAQQAQSTPSAPVPVIILANTQRQRQQPTIAQLAEELGRLGYRVQDDGRTVTVIDPDGETVRQIDVKEDAEWY